MRPATNSWRCPLINVASYVNTRARCTTVTQICQSWAFRPKAAPLALWEQIKAAEHAEQIVTCLVQDHARVYLPCTPGLGTNHSACLGLLRLTLGSFFRGTCGACAFGLLTQCSSNIYHLVGP